MSGKLMHAFVYDGRGSGVVGLKRIEVPVPTPREGEVLLKVEAASLNPVDYKIHNLKALVRPFLKYPLIPGMDLAGEVVKIGPGVKNFKPGDKVVALLDFFRSGGLAEYALAMENRIVLRPPELSAVESAGLPVAGLTALLALSYSDVKLDKSGPHKNVLVTAASGGVGHYAVQLAKLGNVHVTATCGARNIDFVQSLGADEVLDYKTPGGKALVSPSGKKYDAVIHCGPARSWSVFAANLSEHGKVIELTPGASARLSVLVQKLTFSKKRLVPLLLNKADNLDYLVDLVKEGKLKTTVDSVHSFSNAEDAWAKIIDGHATGKIIVEN